MFLWLREDRGEDVFQEVREFLLVRFFEEGGESFVFISFLSFLGDVFIVGVIVVF